MRNIENEYRLKQNDIGIDNTGRENVDNEQNTRKVGNSTSVYIKMEGINTN